MEEKKVPALRFRGFDNAWEQRRLGEVATITMGQSPDGATYSDSPSKYILVQGNADLKDGWVFPRVWTTQKTKVCDKGDLIMSVRAPAGAMGKTAYNAVIGRGVAAIKGNEFIYQRLVKMDLCDYWKKLAAGSTFESINSDIIFNAEIAMPSGKEQKKIGSIFNKLDHLISLHQRKLEMLKKVKKSMLEKMFPKNDAKVPELRFSDFTDAWEQHKLGELSEKTYGGGTPSTANAEYWCGNIPWLQSSDIIDGKLFDVTPKKYISQVGLNSSAAQLIPENSIAIITRVGVGKLAFLSFFYTTSQDFLSMSRLTTEPYFTVYACYKKLQSELNSVQGTSIKGITKDELLAKEIKVPSYDEQKQIGEYFTNLDNLISLHQRKLEKLKNIKKSMLEKMFII